MPGAECQICKEEFRELKLLHFHLVRSHKFTLEKYYYKYYPRYDLYDKQLIKFKNLDFYQSSLFNNRTNLIKYFKNHPNDVDTLVKSIKLRADIKDLKLAPDTVSARTSILPTPIFLKSINQDYNSICQRAGLKTRFDYKQELEFENIKLDIIRDSREQFPLILNDCNVIISALNVGDYTCKNLYKKIYAERKSMNDLIGSISGGYERIIREFERAAEMGFYLVILIEEDLNNLINFDLTKSEYSKVKATSSFICSRIRDLINQFSNIQFLFVKNREEASRILVKIFSIKNNINTVDLQFGYDSGLI